MAGTTFDPTRGGATQVPTQSDEAAANNQLGEARAKDTKDVGRAAEAKPKDATKGAKAGFGSLDGVDKSAAPNPLASEAAQLVIGLASGAAALHASDPVATAAMIREQFAPLVERLVAPEGKPGAAFQLDTFAPPPAIAPVLLENAAIARVAAPLLGLDMESHAFRDTTPASPREARVKLVAQCQKLTAKMVEKHELLALAQTQAFAQLSPQARPLVEQAAAKVAEASALMRAGSPAAIWAKPIAFTGKNTELKKKLDALMGACAGALPAKKDERIPELPDLATVKLEEAAQLMHQAVQAVGGKAGSRQGAEAPITILGGAPSTSSSFAGLDFSGGDVEALAILVMMKGAKLEGDLTMDLLRNMSKVNKQKEALRNMQRRAQEEQARITRDMQNEYSALQATGELHKTITFDQYKQWRACAYAPLEETVNEAGDTSYALPAPQLQMPRPEIPAWMKTGNVGVTAEQTPEGTAKAFGIPNDGMKALRKIFKELKLPDEVTFEDWLQDDVELVMPVEDLDEVLENNAAVRAFLAKDGVEVLGVSAPKPGDQVQTQLLEDLKNAMREYEKGKILGKYFPGTVTDAALDEKQKAIEKLISEAKPPLNKDTADAFQLFRDALYKSDDKGPVGEMAAYEQHVRETIAGLNPLGDEWDRKSADAQRTSGDDDWQSSMYVAKKHDRGSAGSRQDGEGEEIMKTTYKVVVDNNGNPKLVMEQEVAQWFSKDWEADAHDVTNFTVTTSCTNPAVSELMADLGKFTSKQGGAVKELNKDATKAEAPYEKGEHLGKKYTAAPDPSGKDPQKLYDEQVGKLNTGLTGAKDAWGKLGDPNDESSEFRKWVREQGLDQEFNKAEAEKAKAAALAPKPKTPPIVDPETGVELRQSGNLDMVTATLQGVKDKLDSLNGFTEVESLRLQSQMERRSKLLETLSNMLKSLASTKEAIIANTK